MTDRTHVLALDLSLTATGVCWVQPGDIEPDPFTIRTNAADPMGARLAGITSKVLELLDHLIDSRPGPHGPCFAVLEDLPTHARAAGKTGMVHGAVRLALWQQAVPTLTVPPASLKTWATGKGNAGKPEMLAEAIKRLDFGGHDDNEVDALWLWTLGAAVLGDPVVSLPQTHTRALDKLDLVDGLYVEDGAA